MEVSDGQVDLTHEVDCESSWRHQIGENDMVYHVYVSGNGTNSLSHFLMDGQTGCLEARENIPTAGQPGAIATNASGTLMFVALRPQRQFASYAVDGVSGQLSEIGTVDLEDGAAYVRTDNTDRYLLASYYGSGCISVHRIGDDGALSAEPLTWPRVTHSTPATSATTTTAISAMMRG